MDEPGRQIVDPQIEALDLVRARFNLSAIEIGAVSGIAPTSIRYFLATGRAPTATAVRRKLAAFLERAKSATRRDDFRLPLRPLGRRGSK